jgi:membrane protein implicated in regulation of membrane protease activity
MSQPSAMPTPTVLIIGLGLLLLALLTFPLTPFVKLLVGVLLVVAAYSALRSRAQARLSEQRVEALVGELQERVAALEREVRVLRLQGATASAAPRPAEALPAQPPAALSAGLPAARSPPCQYDLRHLPPRDQ